MPRAVYLVDTNVLLRWLTPDDRDFPLTRSVIHKILRQRALLCYTSQNVAEFWNTCTRPLDRNGFGLTPNEADQRAAIFESTLRLLPDIPAIHAEWRRLLVSDKISGAQVHDAGWLHPCVCTGSIRYSRSTTETLGAIRESKLLTRKFWLRSPNSLRIIF